MRELIDALRRGERWAIAKAITIVENDKERARELIADIFKNSGEAKVIGITGPAGAGKSTLIGRLIGNYRSRGFKVGVIAVDPSSSLSGGAILGDRVRMQEHALDDGVYIRSMASRGALGGISFAVRDAIRVMDFSGFKRIIVESVGAGQLDVKISSVADVTIVVLNPQTGDSIQAIKAGLTEIGDIYVVNKADIDGADALYNDIISLIADTRDIKVIKTVATAGKGIKELVDTIEDILSRKDTAALERSRIEAELKDIVINMLMDDLLTRDELKRYVEYIVRKEMDPYKAAEDIVKSKLSVRL